MGKFACALAVGVVLSVHAGCRSVNLVDDGTSLAAASEDGCAECYQAVDGGTAQVDQGAADAGDTVYYLQDAYFLGGGSYLDGWTYYVPSYGPTWNESYSYPDDAYYEYQNAVYEYDWYWEQWYDNGGYDQGWSSWP